MESEDYLPSQGLLALDLAVDVEGELAAAMASDEVELALRCAVRRVNKSGLPEDDVVQEAWIVLMGRVRAGHDPARGSVVAHILGTLHTAALEACRQVAGQEAGVRVCRQHRGPRPRQVALPHPESEVWVAEDEGPAGALERKRTLERIEDLEAAVAALPGSLRRVVRLELSPEMADKALTTRAAVAGLAPSTYRRTMQYAESVLRGHLDLARGASA